MVVVSKNGPYLITGGIDLIGDNIKWLEGHQKSTMLYADVVSQDISPFAMACIEQLVSRTTITKASIRFYPAI